MGVGINAANIPSTGATHEAAISPPSLTPVFNPPNRLFHALPMASGAARVENLVMLAFLPSE
jgi:hypothetical protein